MFVRGICSILCVQHVALPSHDVRAAFVGRPPYVHVCILTYDDKRACACKWMAMCCRLVWPALLLLVQFYAKTSNSSSRAFAGLEAANQGFQLQHNTWHCDGDAVMSCCVVTPLNSHWEVHLNLRQYISILKHQHIKSQVTQ